MQGNDLSAAPTRRIWVTAPVVLIDGTEEVEEKHWFRTTTRERRLVGPNLAVLSRLWQWSEGLGLRLELVFFREAQADTIWLVLERGSANPFADYLTYYDRVNAAHELAFRPDVVGVIDLPEYTSAWGKRGLGIEVAH